MNYNEIIERIINVDLRDDISVIKEDNYSKEQLMRKKNEKLVSIITPMYNAEKYILQTYPLSLPRV